VQMCRCVDVQRRDEVDCCVVRVPSRVPSHTNFYTGVLTLSDPLRPSQTLHPPAPLDVGQHLRLHPPMLNSTHSPASTHVLAAPRGDWPFSLHAPMLPCSHQTRRRCDAQHMLNASQRRRVSIRRYSINNAPQPQLNCCKASLLLTTPHYSSLLTTPHYCCKAITTHVNVGFTYRRAVLGTPLPTHHWPCQAMSDHNSSP
jgi:hypothetical protein